MNGDTDLIQTMAANAIPITGVPGAYDELIDLIGNARATDMGRYGGFNAGQLVKERSDDAAFIIGYTTHAGTALRDASGRPAERKGVPGMLFAFLRYDGF